MALSSRGLPGTKRQKVEAGDDEPLFYEVADADEQKVGLGGREDAPIDAVEDNEKMIDEQKTLLLEVLAKCGIENIPNLLQQQIRNSVTLATRALSSVVFLGESGSGKSTTINALLGLPLLPADSSGDACTAIPIEIHAARCSTKLEGKAKFIPFEDWRDEVSKVKSALHDEGEYDEDTIEKLLQKIQTVYPRLSTRTLKEISVNDILALNDAASKLGTTEDFGHTDWETFRNLIYSYTVASSKTRRNEQLRRRFVLVDVPGVLDSNRARADRARDYLQRCSAACIIAPAQRGGSNSTSYDLLRESIEQVQYGGHLDRVILLNTESDDFETEEIRRRMDHAEINKAFEQKTRAEQELKDMSAERDRSATKLNTEQTSSDDKKKDIILLGRRRNKFGSKGTPILEPEQFSISKNGKRDRNKKIKGKVLSLDEVEALVEKLEAEKKEAEAKVKKLIPQVKALATKLEIMQADCDRAKTVYEATCFWTRNESLKDKQKEMYVKIIRSYDDLAAVAARRAGGNVREVEELSDARYEELQTQLRVFCISAKTYLHLQGIQTFDSAPSTTKNIDDTEIPKLAAHLTTLSARTRRDGLESALNKLVMALHSLYLYVMKSSKCKPVDRAQANGAAEEAATQFGRLSLGFADAVSKAVGTIHSDFQSVLLDGHDKIVAEATPAAVTRMESFGQCPRRHKPSGLYPMEYKAAIHHDGVWEGKRVRFDFNNKIARALRINLKESMRLLFTSENSYAIQAISDAMNQAQTIFEKQYKEIRALAVKAGVSQHALVMVEKQYSLCIKYLPGYFKHAHHIIRAAPGLSYNDMLNDVKAGMATGYIKAQKVSSGSGALAAMAEKVEHEIKRNKGALLNSCLKATEEKLQSVMIQAMEQLARDLDGFAAQMVRDYESAFKQRDAYVMESNDPLRNDLRAKLLASGLISHKKMLESEELRDEAMDLVQQMKEAAVAAAAKVESAEAMDEKRDFVEQLEEAAAAMA